MAVQDFFSGPQSWTFSMFPVFHHYKQSCKDFCSHIWVHRFHLFPASLLFFQSRFKVPETCCSYSDVGALPWCCGSAGHRFPIAVRPSQTLPPKHRQGQPRAPKMTKSLLCPERLVLVSRGCWGNRIVFSPSSRGRSLTVRCPQSHAPTEVS